MPLVLATRKGSLYHCHVSGMLPRERQRQRENRVLGAVLFQVLPTYHEELPLKQVCGLFVSQPIRGNLHEDLGAD